MNIPVRPRRRRLGASTAPAGPARRAGAWSVPGTPPRKISEQGGPSISHTAGSTASTGQASSALAGVYCLMTLRQPIHRHGAIASNHVGIDLSRGILSPPWSTSSIRLYLLTSLRRYAFDGEVQMQRTPAGHPGTRHPRGAIPRAYLYLAIGRPMYVGATPWVGAAQRSPGQVRGPHRVCPYTTHLSTSHGSGRATRALMSCELHTGKSMWALS